MVTDRQLEIVKATVPVLREHGDTITTRFYLNLFEENPELKNIFNMANQAKGDQARALAASVIAYAANIDQLANLGPAVARISHKHCSLGITPEQYPIVGRNLLRAIGEVLGDAATPEIVDAWGAAYGQLADIMISIERAMYAEDAAKGWSGFKPFRIARKERESAVITSFTLVPVDRAPLPLHKAGQYLTVRFEDAHENVQMRHYTVSCAPNPDHYRISVKREPGGVVSNHLHDRLEEGGEVLVHVPHGDFFLDEQDTRPIALFSGGVGITPMLAMLERLVALRSPRPVLFVHAAIDGSVRAFGAREREIAALHPNVTLFTLFDSPREEDLIGEHYHAAGRLSIEALTGKLAEDAECYVCGPRGFMADTDATLAAMGVPTERRQYEAFGPSLTLNP